MKVPPPVSASTFRLVCEGPHGEVRLSPPAYAEYRQVIEGKDEISLKRKAHLERYLGVFCNDIEFYRRLSDEKFKKEQNFPDGLGGSVAVWAFKSWQWRLYGSVLQVGGKRCFVGVEVDATKKKNKADRAKLKSAAATLAALTEYRAK